jgi:hypothetical protein
MSHQPLVQTDPETPITTQPAAVWAVNALTERLRQHPGDTIGPVLVLGADSERGAELWREATGGAPSAAEAFVVMADPAEPGRTAVVGSDARGIVYGTLEILDRLQYGDWQPLDPGQPLIGTPDNRVRGIFRSYVSRVEDSPWFLDRGFWDDYLTELATQRFNRLQLAFGIGVEYGHDPGVTENYLLFSYPFLVDLPEFGVRVVGLDDAERRANLDALRYASSEAARRGIDFFVGFWTAGVELDDGIAGDYTIEGITTDNHAAYVAAAIETILTECPGIAGITLRVHYESGIPEPATEFWKTAFSGVAAVDRPVAIDLHSKGLEAATIDAALTTGADVFITAKFLAEHLGLPYHQTTIRASELPIETSDADFASVTRASRRFTRYGYADYLRDDRRYRVVYRHWPGTQRLLLWGDPAFAAGYSRVASFGGAEGAEFFEPLAYKGRKGSGRPGGRQVYRDPHLADGAAEWRKYRYTYRLLGRLMYDADADPGQWRRLLRSEFGQAAGYAEEALAAASRILPLVSTAHGVSAANSVYWPEMYENLGIAHGGSPNPFYISDSRPPHTFGAAASLDPEAFTTIVEFVDEVLTETPSGRLTTFDVARMLDALATHAEEQADALAGSFTELRSAEVDRWLVDIRAQVGLGRFFADKLRAGVGYEFHQRTGVRDHLRYAVDRLSEASAHWREIVAATSGYELDLAFGKDSHLRGHWADRQESIDRDLTELQAEYAAAPRTEQTSISLDELDAQSLVPPPAVTHIPPSRFTPGDELVIEATAPAGVRLELRYRSANQAESYRSTPFTSNGDRQRAVIPGPQTDSPFDLLYYLIARDPAGHTWHLPTHGPNLANQPYYVVPRRTPA